MMVWMMVVGCLWAGLSLEKPAAVGQSVEPRLLFRLVVNEMPATVAVKDRGAIRIKDEAGRRYSLVPSLDENGIGLQFAEVSVDPTSGVELPHELSTLHLAFNATGVFEAAGMKISLQWTEVRQQSVLSDGNECPDGKCCVVCGGMSVCGCLVVAPCGQCCCSNGCTCDIIDKPAQQTSSVKSGGVAERRR
jgi:hypothetical protein